MQTKEQKNKNRTILSNDKQHTAVIHMIRSVLTLCVFHFLLSLSTRWFIRYQYQCESVSFTIVKFKKWLWNISIIIIIHSERSNRHRLRTREPYRVKSVLLDDLNEFLWFESGNISRTQSRFGLFNTHFNCSNHVTPTILA